MRQADPGTAIGQNSVGTAAVAHPANPLRAAKQAAAEKLAALLASFPADPGLETRLQDLAMATIHQETEGFLRRPPGASEGGAPEPPWIPMAPAELVDRLAAARLVRYDEKERQWHWTDEWLAGQLAYGAFLRGDGREVAERWRAGFRNARTRVAENAFTHLADDCITGDEREWLTLLLRFPLGPAAIARALALRAPAGDEPEIADGLEAFGKQLDQVLGPERALQPVAETVHLIEVLALAVGHLGGFEALNAAHRLLRRRLVEEVEQLVEMRPREMRYVRALAMFHLTTAEAEQVPARALESCARALAAWRRLAREMPGDSWAPGFLLRLTGFLTEVRRETDPERFHQTYAAALEALESLPDDAATREKTLRRQVLLIAWTLAVEWEGVPSGERRLLFEKGLVRLDELIAHCPDNTDYLKGKREFLEEFAKFLEATDPPRAEQLRAEAQRIEVPDPVAATPEASAGASSPSTAPPEAPPPAAPEAPGAEADDDPDRLRAEIREAWAYAREDPARAIRISSAIVDRIARAVLSRELGPLPGSSTPSQVALWAAASPVWPVRLRWVFEVLAWYESSRPDGPASSPQAGPTPGVYCCAAMARVVRWYFEEHLRTPLPPDLTPELHGDSPSEPAPPGPRRLREPGRTIAGAGPGSGSRGAQPRAMSNTRPPTAMAPDRDLEEIPLHPEQVEVARRLGVPPRIRDSRTGMALVLVPGGRVKLRAEPGKDPEHPDLSRYPQLVARIRPFYIGIAPVLQEEWSGLVERQPSAHLGPRLPVTDLTWEEVQAFLARANEGRTGPPLRLPLEPELELAARGGTTTEYWWGDDYLPGWANCSEDGMGSGLQEPNPPGRFPANPYALFDVLGNVKQWCHGAHFPNLEEYTPFRPALDPAADDRALIRGGCWQLPPPLLRFSEPSQLGAQAKYDGTIGFRCARDVES